MRIGEASRASGVSARSLRHYEDEGLIVPGRRGNGFRDYCQSTIDRVLVIRSLLASGLPVRLIREVLPHLADASDVGTEVVCAEFLSEVQSHRDRLAARIEVLSDQRSALDAYLREARRTAPRPPVDLDASVRLLRSPHGDRRAPRHRRTDGTSTRPADTRGAQGPDTDDRSKPPESGAG
ncbi:MerR family transcriptional regulator [Streptomyces sp. NPDC006259]|uniref:MerR family transcriptional regulator n=1 Tax=Streptomyces sp. NPDC006259 TaxID=3364740 RepID=UPI0036748B02